MNREYPKEYRDNLSWRRKILSRARLDPIYRRKVKELFHRDVLFAFNAFFYTLDVRRRPYHHQPFCTYSYQDNAILEIAACIDKGEDIPVEKSRDMGASWIVILIFLWFWLAPDGGADFLLGSRIEDYVDKKGDMRTLLQKARYALYRLPKWLQPKGFQLKHHDNFMKLQNPETGASITGESNNPNFSTGGRYLAILFDEFAKWESTDTAAWTAAGDATPCRIPVSTPFGAAGKYYDIIHSGKKKLRLHWSLHPRKAEGAYCSFPRTEEESYYEHDDELELLVRSPWYDSEEARRTPLEMSQELDINYIGAGNPVFDGKAGKRVIALLRVPRSPERWLLPNFAAEEFAVHQEEPRDLEGYLTIWQLPHPTTSYVLGVDVVEGVEGGDYGVIKVFNRETKSVDASYFSRLDEVQLAKVVRLVAREFNTYEPPWVAIETTGPGLATFDFCDQVHDMENLFMMPVYDTTKSSPSYKKGWKTTTSSRNALVGGVTDWLLESRGWADSRCCRERTTFIRNKTGKPIAKSGAHDDEVISLGICIQVDLLAPHEEKEEKVALRKDGLPENIFDIEAYRKDDPPLSIEDHCLATVAARKSHTDTGGEEVQFYNDMAGSFH